MPRKARIDAPGALHHIIIRGIERKAVFKDLADRDNFIGRLGRIITETDISINGLPSHQCAGGRHGLCSQI